MLNNAPLLFGNNVAPITAFSKRPPSPPIFKFIRSTGDTPASLTDVQRESAMNVTKPEKFMDDLPLVIQTHIDKKCAGSQNTQGKGGFINFSEDEYVLYARDKFYGSKKLCLRWNGSRRVVKPLNDYAFKIKNLRSGDYENVQSTMLKSYLDSPIKKKVVLSCINSSETGLLVSRLYRFYKDDREELIVAVHRKGLCPNDDMMKLIMHVYEEVSNLLKKLFNRKSASHKLHDKVHVVLGFQNREF